MHAWGIMITIAIYIHIVVDRRDSLSMAVVIAGANGRTPQFGNFAQPDEQTAYVTPGYLRAAIRRKYGRSIFVIGAVESALAEFWDTVETKGINFNKNECPEAVEVSRIIVDITAKEHCNDGCEKDKMQVETSQTETRKEKKSYSLSFGKQFSREFGGGLDIGASFFNTASASIGIQGKRTSGKSKSQEVSKEEERELAQTYGVTSKIAVPAKTKVKVRITTYAVTYKLKVKAMVSAPATSYIPFYYKRCLGNFCCAGAGPTFRKFGYITARELFERQDNFRDLGYCVQFTTESEVSYIGETAEMTKREESLRR